MRILFPVSECYPYAKTGGLGDVAGSLPQALAELGMEVHVVLPLYQKVWQAKALLEKTEIHLQVPIGQDIVTVNVWQRKLTEQGPTYHFLQYDPYYDRPELYGTVHKEYADNDRRFILLARGALELGKYLGRPWDIVHCHDWHTGLIPVYLKTVYAAEPVFAQTRTVLTIHNLAYQGHFEPEIMNLAHLPWDQFVPEGLEFWGGLNFMKAGITYADWINAVSPTYAKEIQTPEYGQGLDGVIQSREKNISGILNGVDYTVWNPETDGFLPQQYSWRNLEAKAAVKQELFTTIGMYPVDKAPLIGIISRLDDQKGFDILSQVGERLLQQNLQMVVLGVGAKRYHDFFFWLKAHYPRKISLHLEYNERLAHLIYGGTDMFLMPSRFEPCGLGQLISMRYGSIPIVRSTGGLADTVEDIKEHKGNGFSFTDYLGETLLQTVKRALGYFSEPQEWEKIMVRAMTADFSWARSAQEYIQLYQKLVKKKR